MGPLSSETWFARGLRSTWPSAIRVGEAKAHRAVTSPGSPGKAGGAAATPLWESPPGAWGASVITGPGGSRSQPGLHPARPRVHGWRVVSRCVSGNLASPAACGCGLPLPALFWGRDPPRSSWRKEKVYFSMSCGCGEQGRDNPLPPRVRGVRGDPRLSRWRRKWRPAGRGGR